MFDYDDYDIVTEAQQALYASKQKKDAKIDILKEAKRIAAHKDYARDLYQPFDELTFESKIKVDMMYYEQLFNKLEDDVKPQMESVFIALFRNVKQVYEFVNIEPEIYGNGVTVDILDESMENAQVLLSKNIYENLDRNFYKLTATQRKEKYLEESRTTITSLIESGGIEPEDAIKFGIKVAVLENLIQSISFPTMSYARIKHFTECEMIGKTFDQERLSTIIENFNIKAHNISKIIATCV